MANKTVTVRPSGGDYTSLQVAITGEVAANADLTATGLDGILTISIEGTWSSADTTMAVLSGFTVDATHYVVIQADAANRAGASWSTSKYQLAPSSGDYGLKIANYYSRIIGLQIKGHAATGRLLDVDAYFCTVDSCLVTGTSGWNGAVYVQGEETNIINVIAYDIAGGNAAFDFQKGSRAYNCLAVGSAGVGFQFNDQAVVAKNCYSGGNTGADYAGTGSYALTTCLSEDGTLSTSTAAYSAATFSSVTEGSEDFHLAAGSALVDAGTSLAADAAFPFDYDITGATRSGTWDIGALNATAEAATTPTGIATGAPVLGTPSLTVTSAANATGIATAAPSCGATTVTCTSATTPIGFAAGAPTLGYPSLETADIQEMTITRDPRRLVEGHTRRVQTGSPATATGLRGYR